MPKTTSTGKPILSELPAPLRRSPAKAQKTFAQAHDNALREYGGDEARAHRVAYSALERKFAREGDRWLPKGHSESGTREELYERARALGVPGRSRMSKRQLAAAVAARR
jgi:cation transport regulator ChaB